MRRKIITIIIGMGIIVLLLGILLYAIDHKRMIENKPVIFSTWGKSYAPTEKQVTQKNQDYKNTEEIQFALTMNDEITNNTAWCGTFQLIWNDLKNDLAKQDIVFTPQIKVVENLNKGDFNTTKISEESYYKVYGKPTLQLKEQIEKAIKEKFNETSDILDDFDWKSDESYLLYSMLRKDFQFATAFEELEKGTFANKYQDVSYFGVKKGSKSNIEDQVIVLYYNSDDDFAIKLVSKEKEEVILCKTKKQGKTFHEIYQNIQDNAKNYNGIMKLTEFDELKIPNIKMKEKRTFEELIGKPFQFADGTEHLITQAIQTIEFELDKSGGKIKSEAGITNDSVAICFVGEPKERKFYLDDTFTIFLKEEAKDMPYFAATISDITKFQ